MDTRNVLPSIEKYQTLLDEFRTGRVDNQEAALKHLYRLLQNTLNMAADAEQDLQKQHREIEVLQKLTHIDNATGLYNRRGLEMMVNREISLIRHELASQGTVVHISIVNRALLIKQYSAEAAFEVELAIADLIKQKFRSFDVVARTGQGEYSILMPQARKVQVREIHKSIRETLLGFKIKWRGRNLPAFLTIAIAEINEDSIGREVLNRVFERAHDNDGNEFGTHQIH